MANINSNITPRGLSQKDLVDALYMFIASLTGICAKLDLDGGVPLTTYKANCITAIFNVVVEDSKGKRTGQGIAETSAIEPTHIITPTGVSDAALNACLYQCFNAMETLTEQLDTDSLTLSNYEATAYTACFMQLIENVRGNTLGNGTVFKFKPGGMFNQKELVDCLYNMFLGIYQLCADQTTTGLDVDGTVTGTNYTALWYTAVLTLMIENSRGSTIGISR